tara:strand:+ start:2917 stop:3405 length:489 start_codon:yes stop_codon:yes gene_type:complete
VELFKKMNMKNKLIFTSMNQTKRVFAIILISCFLQISCQDANNKKVEPEKLESKEMEKQSEALLRHLVIFKFNDDANEADVQELNDSFNALPNHISAIKDFEWGLNDSPENFHQDFTHCYLITFNSEKDRDSIYTPHPKHQEFVASLQPFVEKVFVVDYWAK